MVDKAFSILEMMQSGERLGREDSKQLERVVDYLIKEVEQARRCVLSHDSLQNTIGGLLEHCGFDVKYAVQLKLNGSESDHVIFDVVAEDNEELLAVEVKDNIDASNLVPTHEYTGMSSMSKEKAKVFWGTDILDFDYLSSGATGEMVKDFMKKFGIGVMIADRQFLIICENHRQFSLQEMPKFLFPDDF